MPQEPGASEPPEAQRPPSARRRSARGHREADTVTAGRALGLNTGPTGYHLREPVRYGFVEETDGTPPGARTLLTRFLALPAPGPTGDGNSGAGRKHGPAHNRREADPS
ncbi:hypothetical protein [Streptomyces sp. enrichment culture]|uniref:hypothetical protein n=1 Tax=Streptomyces sp. enrichment culture TaxID=1795815 RepID=UPI003F54B2E1